MDTPFLVVDMTHTPGVYTPEKRECTQEKSMYTLTFLLVYTPPFGHIRQTFVGRVRAGVVGHIRHVQV